MATQFTARISRMLAGFAWFTAIVISLSPPLAYFAKEYAEIVQNSRHHAEMQAKLTNRFIGRHSQDWSIATERLAETLEDIRQHDWTTRIVDVEGRVLFEAAGKQAWPYYVTREPIYEFGLPAGFLIIEVSLHSSLVIAAVIALASTLFGFGVLLPVWRYAFRTLEDSAHELERSDARFASVMAATTDGIWEQDIVSGRIVYVSPQTETMLGYPVGRFTRPDFRLHAVITEREDWRRMQDGLERHVQMGLPYICEVRVRHADGHLVWCRIRGKVERDLARLPLRIVGSIVDITREHEDTLRLARYQAFHARLLDLMPDAITVKDENLRFTLANRAFAAMTGRPQIQILGQRTRDLYPEAVAKLIEDHDREVLKTGGPLTLEVQVPHAGFEGPRMSLLTKVRIEDADGRPQILGIHHDITELHEHRDHLADLVQAQTVDLRQAKEAAEQASQAKSEFLANMSHELRTPMHAILSFARIGHFKAATAPPERLREYFEHIRLSGERLLELVNDLLDLSKLEAGRMQYAMAAFDLQRCIDETLIELRPLLEGKHLHCEVRRSVEDAHLQGDRKRLAQVLHNLLANAIKFSPEGGQILIELAPARMPSGRRAHDTGEVDGLQLAVLDAGVGIPEEELDAIFDKFTQSSRTRSGAGGTGLGLAICREIMQAHRGIIRAYNRPEGGAAFEVLLPRYQEAAA